jgi:hypothetical protein
VLHTVRHGEEAREQMDQQDPDEEREHTVYRAARAAVLCGGSYGGRACVPLTPAAVLRSACSGGPRKRPWVQSWVGVARTIATPSLGSADSLAILSYHGGGAVLTGPSRLRC